jgi:hypothetical protein
VGRERELLDPGLALRRNGRREHVGQHIHQPDSSLWIQKFYRRENTQITGSVSGITVLVRIWIQVLADLTSGLKWSGSTYISK